MDFVFQMRDIITHLILGLDPRDMNYQSQSTDHKMDWELKKSVPGSLTTTCSSAPNLTVHIQAYRTRAGCGSRTVLGAGERPNSTSQCQPMLSHVTFIGWASHTLSPRVSKMGCCTCLTHFLSIVFYTDFCVCAHAHVTCVVAREHFAYVSSLLPYPFLWGRALHWTPLPAEPARTLTLFLKWNGQSSLRTVVITQVKGAAGFQVWQWHSYLGEISLTQSWKYQPSLRKVTQTSRLRVIGLGEVLVTIATWLRKGFN